jgi:GNAT superfamily N-acetyltransferase
VEQVELTLEGILARAEKGEFPAADLELTVCPAPSPRASAVVAFTGHTVVATDADPDWVRSQLPPGDLSAPLNPPFLAALCDRLGLRVNNIDMLLLAPAGTCGVDGGVEGGVDDLVEVTDRDHPRVRRALRYRDEVRVWACEGGVVLLGRGLAGRTEAAVEVEPAARGRGWGRRLAAAARALAGGPLWAQVAPGNAASVRAFLAAGYLPVGAEALLVPDRAAGWN